MSVLCGPQSIYRGLQTLNTLVPPGSTDRSIAIPEGEDTQQRYIMKRTFREGGEGMLFFSYPSSLLQVRIFRNQFC